MQDRSKVKADIVQLAPTLINELVIFSLTLYVNMGIN